MSLTIYSYVRFRKLRFQYVFVDSLMNINFEQYVTDSFPLSGGAGFWPLALSWHVHGHLKLTVSLLLSPLGLLSLLTSGTYWTRKRDIAWYMISFLLPPQKFLFLIQNFFWNHFLARVVGFIVLPLFLYLFFFAVHLGILSNTGPGDAFMSPSFQETLRGNELLLKSHGMFAFCVLTVMHIAHAIGRNPILRYCHY